MQPYNEAKKIWDRMFQGRMTDTHFASLKPGNTFDSIFFVGDYYYYIFNVPDALIETVSDGTLKLLGYKPEEFTVPFILEQIHPEDMPYFLEFEGEATVFLQSLPADKVSKYKIRYDYRIRRKDGRYIRILQQSVTMEQGPNGEVARALGMHTDIDHFKKEGRPVLSFIGQDGEPSFIDVQVKKSLKPSQELLSKRERQVLQHLMSGISSSEIAKILFLSKNTVTTHRRNMLKKTNCKNTGELIGRAVREGYL